MYKDVSWVKNHARVRVNILFKKRFIIIITNKIVFQKGNVKSFLLICLININPMPAIPSVSNM